MEYTTTITTTIKTSELRKLMKQKGITTFYKLAQVSGVNYAYLNKAINGHLKMSESSWNKIKVCL